MPGVRKEVISGDRVSASRGLCDASGMARELMEIREEGRIVRHITCSKIVHRATTAGQMRRDVILSSKDGTIEIRLDCPEFDMAFDALGLGQAFHLELKAVVP